MVMGVVAWGEVTSVNSGSSSLAWVSSSCQTASTSGSDTSSAPRSSHRRNQRWDPIFQTSTPIIPTSQTTPKAVSHCAGSGITHRGQSQPRM